MKKHGVSAIICSFISALCIWICYMLCLPAINLRASSFYVFIIFDFAIIVIVFGIREFILDEYEHNLFRILRNISLIALVVVLIMAIFNSAIVTSRTLQAIPEVKEGNFQEDYVEISSNPAEAFTLDLDSAIRLGDRAIGNIENASWYEVNDEFNLITYNGSKYRVSPLEYGGLFKYFRANDDGIPGYVIVNDDTLEAQFVKTEKPIRYSPSAHFGYLLKRHLRSQFPSYTFTDSIFEINEEGHSFWITGVTQPHASVYAGRVVEKVIVTDPYSGESEVYDLDQVPEWIDHVYNLDYLMTLAKWHYSYVRGFWNTVFSETGVYKTSYSYRASRDDKEDETANFYGYNSYINKNGQTVFVTGITPANKSESNTGFLTLNAKTAELIYYSAEGAEESSAQQACESKMQNYGYKATYPVFVNVGGQPTYMMALKDKAGIIQAYGFVNLKNYSISTVDKDINVALSAYKQAIGMEVEDQVVSEDTIQTITGTIDEIYSQTINGTTYYYYVIDRELYKASVTVNELQFLYKVGDTVEVKYQDGSGFRTIISISN